MTLLARSGRDEDIEIVVLRHQLMVMRRQIDRPALTEADRSLLGAVATALPRARRADWLVIPDTLLHWHPRRIRPPLDPTTPQTLPATHRRRRPEAGGAHGP